MKKIIALVIAILMIAALAIPAMAEESDETEVTVNAKDFNNEGGDATTLVEFGVTGGYTITIPQKITFDSNRQGTAVVTASSVVLAGNETLNITVKSNNYGTTTAGKWVMKEKENKSTPVDYTITMPGDPDAVDVVSNSTVVLAVTTADSLTATGDVTSGYTDTVTLSLATPGTSQVGTYQDTLTFAAAIAGPQQNG